VLPIHWRQRPSDGLRLTLPKTEGDHRESLPCSAASSPAGRSPGSAVAVLPVALVWGTGLAVVTSILSTAVFAYLFLSPSPTKGNGCCASCGGFTAWRDSPRR